MSTKGYTFLIRITTNAFLTRVDSFSIVLMLPVCGVSIDWIGGMWLTFLQQFVGDFRSWMIAASVALGFVGQPENALSSLSYYLRVSLYDT